MGSSCRQLWPVMGLEICEDVTNSKDRVLWDEVHVQNTDFLVSKGFLELCISFPILGRSE